jgi:hypothetical protein
VHFGNEKFFRHQQLLSGGDQPKVAFRRNPGRDDSAAATAAGDDERLFDTVADTREVL